MCKQFENEMPYGQMIRPGVMKNIDEGCNKSSLQQSTLSTFKCKEGYVACVHAKNSTGTAAGFVYNKADIAAAEECCNNQPNTTCTTYQD